MKETDEEDNPNPPDKIPTVTIVIATYDRPKKTQRLLRSIKRAYKQFETHHGWAYPVECKVCMCVEDLETKRAVKNVNWSMVTIVETSVSRAGYNRDKGIRLADGDYVALVDSDCVMAGDWFHSLHHSLVEHNYPDAIQGAYYYSLEQQSSWYALAESRDDYIRFQERRADTRNLIISHSLYFNIGGFDRYKSDADAAEDRMLRKRVDEYEASFIFDENIVVQHEYPETLTGNLRRYFYYGKSAYILKCRRPKLFKEDSNPNNILRSGLSEIYIGILLTKDINQCYWGAYRSVVGVVYILGYYIRRCSERFK